MSLDFAGVSVKILVDVKTQHGTREFNAGYGYCDKHNPGDAMRRAVEEFISSAEFKEFTEKELHSSLNVRLEFLTHTRMPR